MYSHLGVVSLLAHMPLWCSLSPLLVSPSIALTDRVRPLPELLPLVTSHLLELAVCMLGRWIKDAMCKAEHQILALELSLAFPSQLKTTSSFHLFSGPKPWGCS